MKRQTAPTLIVIAAVLWGLDGVIRRSLYVLHPAVIVFFETLAASLILLPFAFFVFKKNKLTLKVWLLTGLIAVLSGLLGTLWFTTALLRTQHIPFSVVFLLQQLQPLFAVILAVVLLKEKIGKKYLFWALLALTAAYFMTFKNGRVNFHTGQGTIIAALYALGAAFAWGSCTVISKMLLNEVSAAAATILRFFLTAIAALAAVFILGQGKGLMSLTLSQGLRFVLIALSTGMAALWLYYKGLKHTQAKIATILELTFPLVAVLIDVFLYHTILSYSQYAAAVVLVYAMYRVVSLGPESGGINQKS